jgi:ATP-dependent 26S proteasome regulatory subunit
VKTPKDYAMPELAATGQRTADKETAYSTSWAHFEDELRRLDLLIHLEVLTQQNRSPASPLDQFKGLVISEEEVARLLTGADSLIGESAISPDGLKAQILYESLDQLESQIEQRRAASLEEGIYLHLPHLSHLFHLTRFEEQCVLICLAPELDRKYEKLYAYAQDDVTRRKPSMALVLDLLCPTMPEKLAARVVFDPQAPLLKYRLVQMIDNPTDAPAPLVSRFLKLDDRIVSFLLGHRGPDARLDPFARLVYPAETAAAINVELQERMGAFLRAHFDARESDHRSIVFHLSGPYGSGKRPLVEWASRELGLPLIVGDIERMKDGPASFEEISWLLAREAALQPAVLCLENLDCLLGEPDKHRAHLKALLDASRTFSRVTFLSSTKPWQPIEILRGEIFIPLELPRSDTSIEKQIWESQTDGRDDFAAEVDWGVLSSKFRLSPGQIRDALTAAANLARWRSPANARITMADLHAGCRAQATPKLDQLARRLTPKYTWADIILPDDQTSQLHEMCEQARNRHIVYGEWGFARKLSRGKGLNALFAGPPGTGKTMAAEVIATELQLDLFQIDLSQVVSKYIGETEKNLFRIFEEAQASNAILFFDEADALFGKRSEVKDAHDRYANIEIGYLLQKMEEYEGIAILATNLRHHLDEAFVRRMQFIVEFPFPDEQYRRQIWQVIFPREAPLESNVDFNLLAREIKLAGGNIKSIALAAAFYAAEDGRVIGVSQVVRAARREFQKLGRTWAEAEQSLPSTPIQ